MVLPLIARAVVSSKVRHQNTSTQRRRGARKTNNELVRQGRATLNARRTGVLADSETGARRKAISLPLLNEARSFNNSLGDAVSGVRKIRAVVATTFLSWTVLPFYVPQIMMWLLGLSGLGLEGLPVANILFPGTELFMFTYVVIGIIGICSMAYAAWIYTIRLVPCISGNLTLVFILCLTMYLVPFLNLFPWVMPYMIAVVLASRKEEPEEA